MSERIKRPCEGSVTVITRHSSTTRDCARQGAHKEGGVYWCAAHRPSVTETKEARGKARARAAFAAYDTGGATRSARDALAQAIWDAKGFLEEHRPLVQEFVEAMRAYQSAREQRAALEAEAPNV